MALTREIVEKELQYCLKIDGDGNLAALCRHWLATQWQPIETAPKDHTDVLVRCGGFVATMHFTSREYLLREYGDPEHMEEGWYFDCGYPNGFPEVPFFPAHWQPLPPPPTASSAKDEP